jgi:hypothetical protein
MGLNQLLCRVRNYLKRRRSAENGRGDNTSRVRSHRPLLEVLEDRITPTVFTPFQIRTAYGINSILPFGMNQPADGTGQAIAIIDPYNDPTIIPDLNTFDTNVSLTAVTPGPGNPSLFVQYGAASTFPTSFLQVFNQSGTNITQNFANNTSQNVVNGVPGVDPQGPGAKNSGEEEESLDVEWAHAIAPGAKIDLIECNNFGGDHTAIPPATGLPNVSVVSMSFGTAEYENPAQQETADDSYFIQPSGVTFVASTGDTGNPGQYPAFSPYVLAVGGTTLTLNPANSWLSETAWIGSGGGVSQYESKPSYQVGVPGTGNNRSIPDVSFDGDPNTGVVIVDTYDNQSSVGGTSLSCPCWAGLIAIANQGRVLAGEAPLNSFNPQQTLQILYGIGNNPSQYALDFHDIATGSNEPVAKVVMTPNPKFSGSGYSQVPVTVNLSSAGGKNAIVTFTTSFGGVTNFNIAQAGTGYAPTAGLPISGAGGTGATASITSVSMTGAITGFSVTAPGTGYLSVDFVGGGGAGATGVPLINIFGQITGVNITNTGTLGYTSTPKVVFTGGGFTTPATGAAILFPGSSAQVGYDTVTGLGSPIANNLIPALVNAPIDLFGIYGNARLGQVSDQAPALGTVDNESFIAFRGREDHQLCIIQLNPSGSTDNNVEFTSPAYTVSGSPSLATVNGTMCVAWADDSSHHIYVAPVIIDSNGIITLGQVVDTGEATDDSPALAAFDGSLFVAWTPNGSGDNLLSVMQLDDNLNPILPVYTSGATVNDSPALAASGGQLFVAWAGRTNGNHLFVSTVNTGSTISVPPPTQLPDTSGQGPALADQNGQLVISWSESGNRVLKVMQLNTVGGISESTRVANASDITNGGTVFDGAPNGPALLSKNGFLFLAWNGEDSAGDLYVAPVGFTTQPVSLQAAAIITAQLNANDPNTMQVFKGATLLNSYGVGTFNQIVESGVPGGTTLILNFGNGNFIPSAGILFDGGSSGNGTLILKGDSFTDEVITPTGPNEGTITLDGSTIVYSDVSSIIDTDVVTNLTVNGTASAGEQVNFINDPSGTENGVATDEINSATRTFTKVDFGNKTNVTFQGGAGGDTYNINSTTAAAKLATLSVDGASAGSDTFNVATISQAVAAIINTGEGTSTVNVTPISQDLGNLIGALTVNGGAGGTTTLVADDQEDPNSETYTLTSSVFGTTNSARIGYSNLGGITLNGGTSANNRLAILERVGGGDTWTISAGTQSDSVQVQGTGANNASIPGTPITACGLNTLSIDTTLNAHQVPLSRHAANTYVVNDLSTTLIRHVDIDVFESRTANPSPDTITVDGTQAPNTADMVGVTHDAMLGPQVEDVTLTKLAKREGHSGTTLVPVASSTYTVSAGIPSSADTLTVNTCDGPDQVHVFSTAGAGSTYINTGAGTGPGGNNQIVVGDATSATGLNDIEGPLFINAGNGADNSLTFTEAGSYLGDTLTLTNDALIRYLSRQLPKNREEPAQERYLFDISYQATGSDGSIGAFGGGIALDTTRGPDTVYVLSVPDNSHVTVNTGVSTGLNLTPPQPDQVYVGYDAGNPDDTPNPLSDSTLDAILSPVSVVATVASGAPAAKLFIEDQGADRSERYNVQRLAHPNVETVERSGAWAISASAADIDMTLDAGNQANQIAVDGVTPGMLATINAGAGDDTIQMAGSITSYAGLLAIDGQGGVNTLDYSTFSGPVTVDLPLDVATAAPEGVRNIQNVVGGSGNDVFVGNGAGSVLTGGTGRNILIAGSRAGTLRNNSGQSMLVGGTTIYDENLIALAAIMAEWASAAPYAVRVPLILHGGPTGRYALNANAFTNNGGGNVLIGGPPSRVAATNLYYGIEALDTNDWDSALGEVFVQNQVTTITPTIIVSDAGGTYNGQPFPASPTATGTRGAAVNGTFSLTYTDSAGNKSATAPTVPGSYTVTASFTSDDPNYSNGQPASASFRIAPATPTIQVGAASGDFNGQPVAVTATVAGVVSGVDNTPGPTLEGVGLTLQYFQVFGNGSSDSLFAPPTSAGNYQVVATFAGSTDYASASSQPASFTILQAAPRIQVSAASDDFNGQPVAVTATVAGVVSGVDNTPGPTLEGVGLTLQYFQVFANGSSDSLFAPPTNAGNYQVIASFAGSTDYASTSSQPVAFTISQATPTIQLSAPSSTYNGQPFAVTATVAGVVAGVDDTPGPTLEGVGLTLGYYVLYDNITDYLGTTAPIVANNYEVIASFLGSTDYGVSSQSATFTIFQATPVIQVSAAGGDFNGQPVAVTATVAGVVAGVDDTPGPTLEGYGLTLTYYAVREDGSSYSLPSAPTTPGNYQVIAIFPGSTDYATTYSQPVAFTIKPATPTVTLSSSLNPSFLNESVTFTVVVQAPNGGTPQGLVTFYDGNQVLGSVALANGNQQVSFTTNALTSGVHTITALYSDTSDNDFYSIFSSGLSQEVRS